MRNYNNKLFNEALEQIVNRKEIILEINIPENEFISLQYFLTRCHYYSVVVDDYPFEIKDKNSLLEALYYQVKLITIHSLNWDAIQEGFEDLLNDNIVDFEGICLLFKSKEIKDKIASEMNILSEIVSEVNESSDQKKVVILIKK